MISQSPTLPGQGHAGQGLAVLSNQIRNLTLLSNKHLRLIKLFNRTSAVNYIISTRHLILDIDPI